MNKCARESGFDRKNFIRKLIRGIPVKRNSYNEFVRWLQHYESTNQIKSPKVGIRFTHQDPIDCGLPSAFLGSGQTIR